MYLTDAPHTIDGYFEWDRFLEGGGRPMLALAAAALAIVAGYTLDRGRTPDRGSAACEAIDAPQFIIDDRG